MTEHSAPPSWFIVLVALAVVAGVALAFWFYAFLSGPSFPP